MKSFLQRDLFQGLIYKHSGEKVFEDSFDFILSNVLQPPNLSDRHVSVFIINPISVYIFNPISVYIYNRSVCSVPRHP